ncbi:hypothetical protein [Bradyrhizobium ivorense]|uniref:hypothetical protein n=1 Tax=Bradyrhizobium ivorense TaxID=2511166 RepID=UPI0010BB157F|nr:hypothetical protein [Bradyrhizobium ivorense]VIO72162.1 hypothetical protein CI41S_35290 [Bradyrhizobium ivorense]
MLKVLKVLKVAVHIVWAIAVISFATLVGASYGWVHHGWIGAVALGTVGFCAGALLATDLSVLLEFLCAGL